MAITQPTEPTPALPDEPTVRRLLAESVRRTHFLRRLLRLIRLDPGAAGGRPARRVHPERPAAAGVSHVG